MIKRLLLTLALLAAFVPGAARAWEDREDTTVYAVVYNHEWQYSVWPADREFPLGWKSADFSGPKQDCLDFIERVWVDMRPRSLREKMISQGFGTDRCISADLPPHKCQP